MRVLLLSILSFGLLFAIDINYGKLLNYYKEKNYKKTCRYAKTALSKLDNSFLSIVGDACAKEDDINILGIIVAKLNKTKNDRANASYFATLILEKKLLYQFMNDELDLSGLVLPKTEHILSRVLEKLAQKRYKITKNKIVADDKPYRYILWLSSDSPPKLYIDEYKDMIFVKRHWFR